MTTAPRILVLGELGPDGIRSLNPIRAEAEIVHTDTLVTALDHIRQGCFDLFVAQPDEGSLLNTLHRILQAERVLTTMSDGVALVDSNSIIRWANPTFEQWATSTPIGQQFYEALDCTPPSPCPIEKSLTKKSTSRSTSQADLMHCRGNRWIEFSFTRVIEPGMEHPLLLAMGEDVTRSLQQRQQLDALHQAGQQLANLSSEFVGELSPEERIELLRSTLLRLMHDLFRYEMIEIRLLEKASDKLVPLLQEGMTEEAGDRPLSVAPEGAGVTGRVAATRKSYVCSDTSKDPFYLPGAEGARSSLTVPLLFGDQLVGTLNLESPRKRAFTESDVKFAETFAREIASALGTLELLTAQQHSSASRTIEAVSREIALPIDDILANTTAILDRYIGHDPELAERLGKVLTSARALKASIQKVGEKLPTPPAKPTTPEEKVPSSLEGLRVLVIDNDNRVRRSAHNLLGRWGCVVETAGDGQEALTMARLGNYDVILSDIRLPDVDGYEMYMELCKVQPRAEVLLMTGYGYDPTHTIVKARQQGLRHILCKPFRVDQLLEALADPVPNSTHHGTSTEHGLSDGDS